MKFLNLHMPDAVREDLNKRDPHFYDTPQISEVYQYRNTPELESIDESAGGINQFKTIETGGTKGTEISNYQYAPPEATAPQRTEAYVATLQATYQASPSYAAEGNTNQISDVTDDTSATEITSYDSGDTR